jgi:hypothetical protein
MTAKDVVELLRLSGLAKYPEVISSITERNIVQDLREPRERAKSLLFFTNLHANLLNFLPDSETQAYAKRVADNACLLLSDNFFADLKKKQEEGFESSFIQDRSDSHLVGVPCPCCRGFFTVPLDEETKKLINASELLDYTVTCPDCKQEIILLPELDTNDLLKQIQSI